MPRAIGLPGNRGYCLGRSLSGRVNCSLFEICLARLGFRCADFHGRCRNNGKSGRSWLVFFVCCVRNGLPVRLHV